MYCLCWTNVGGNGRQRFLLKLSIILLIWTIIIITLYNVNSINIMDMKRMPPHRYLLQNKQYIEQLLTRHQNQIISESTTTAAAAAAAPSNRFNKEPIIDKSPPITDDLLLKHLEERMPNLPPMLHLTANSNTNINKNKSPTTSTIPIGLNRTCARYPNIFDLEFNNLYWQQLKTTNGTFQLFGAYLDKRKLNRLGPTIRILGMIDRIEPTVKTHCQIWLSNQSEPLIVKTFEYKYIWYKKWGNYKQGIYQPYLLACVLPKKYEMAIPVSVSLVERYCDNATNNLRVIYNLPPPTLPRRNFAVCVKGLDFLYEDLSVRLVEWIELLLKLGVDKIFFYQLQVHKNISKVLDYYERQGTVHVTPINLAGNQPNAPIIQHLYLSKKTNHKRQNELIPYNDCFYKHMYEYKFIVLLDIDEVIMPVKKDTWLDLMTDVLHQTSLSTDKSERASYNVRNVYFLDDLIHSHGWFKEIPKYMHMLQHVYRTKNYTKPGQYVKCFHNTEKVLTLHNHFPLSCLNSTCTSYAINVQDAQLNHYRADCVKTLKKTCEQFRKTNVMDTTIWKYKNDLIKRVSDVLDYLGFF